ncbi:response regulator [Bradyrhizobium sp. 192]|uniref:response regulator n=1 Tax=Bradyrhizobium sp. 192 TaxID=2782660 RepID=UPI001FFE734A|nr:response regulator [Bradyrhizobium sp. 192]UPJ60961.1 response regulator [Bradyrhizobium sp. 192]
MRVLATTAIVNALVRAFPASSLQALALKQLLLFCGAVFFIWLLSTTYGLDLSAGFF